MTSVIEKLRGVRIDADHAQRYLAIIQPGSTSRQKLGLTMTSNLLALHVMTIAAEDDSVTPAYMEEVFREALFAREQARYRARGIDFRSAHYVPEVNPNTLGYLTFFECHVHKFKLITVSIATSTSPESHAVDNAYLAQIAGHYPEFSRFVPLLRADFDKQNEPLCYDFLTNDAWLLAIYMNARTARERQCAMVMWVYGQAAMAFDMAGLTARVRRLYFRKAERLTGNMFDRDMHRVGPTSAGPQGGPVSERSYGLQRGTTAGFPSALL